MALADFTAAEVAAVTAAVIDYHERGKSKKQNKQIRPFFDRMMQNKKPFPGGKELITGPVKAYGNDGWQGYSGSDPVTFRNPTGLKRYAFNWFELHSGLSFTHTELKHAGITVTENGAKQSNSVKSRADTVMLTNLLEEKLDSFDEENDRSMNLLLYRDGTSSAKVFPGLRALVRDNPTVGVVGGIDAAANTWWRNRARTAASGGVIATNTTTLNGIATLQTEVRQLRRYGGMPNFAVAGNGAIEKLEAEVRARGDFTQTGFASDVELSMGDLTIKGIGKIQYDPTLDDEGLTNRVYLLDTRHIYLRPMEGEDGKMSDPPRPENILAQFHSRTWTGGMVVDQLNCHGVYDFS